MPSIAVNEHWCKTAVSVLHQKKKGNMPTRAARRKKRIRVWNEQMSCWRVAWRLRMLVRGADGDSQDRDFLLIWWLEWGPPMIFRLQDECQGTCMMCICQR